MDFSANVPGNVLILVGGALLVLLIVAVLLGGSSGSEPLSADDVNVVFSSCYASDDRVAFHIENTGERDIDMSNVGIRIVELDSRRLVEEITVSGRRVSPGASLSEDRVIAADLTNGTIYELQVMVEGRVFREECRAR